MKHVIRHADLIDDSASAMDCAGAGRSMTRQCSMRFAKTTPLAKRPVPELSGLAKALDKAPRWFKLRALASSLLLASLAAASSAQPAPRYRVVDSIVIGGEARWDYLTVDSSARRLYVSHHLQTEVIDTQSNRKTGTIAGTAGVHGIAFASDLRRGFTSNGEDDSVTVFDLDSLAITGTWKVGSNPDAIVYEPRTHRVFTFNGRSRDISAIDARTGTLIATIAVEAKPEFAQVARNGDIYFNLETSNELAVLDPVELTVRHRYPLAPCEGPTGLALDDDVRRVYTVCANKTMIVSTFDGARVAQVPIGAGSDGVAALDGYAYAANGTDGTVTQARVTADGRVEWLTTVSTQAGARTIAADPATHRLYLPTASFAAPAGPQRRIGQPDTFHVLVLKAD